MKAASGVLSSKKISVSEAKAAETQKMAQDSSEAVPVSTTETAQSHPDSAATSETAPADQSSENLFEKVSKAIVERFSGENAPTASTVSADNPYPFHTNISTTLFWAGEEADKDNKNISNLPSAWDEEWVKHFGGIDDPKKRSEYMPSKFSPKENPFYFALPYNDFNAQGKHKKEINAVVPWAGKTDWKKDESVLKNQWIKIVKNDKVAYAQWEDVGPFEEDDAEYVFGTAQPKSKTNKHAGLDVSPAVHDMLGLLDIDTVDWQFVDADQVPDGPWKNTITTSQVFWK